MIVPGDSVLVGLSGGADSVSLLCVLNELKDELFVSRIVAAHLHHGLRATADNDMDFCEKLCKNLGIDFYKKKVDIKSLAREINTCDEDAGRIARYEFFKELSTKLSISKIATAHNMNDQAETFLMRVLSGSSLGGLLGIKPVREDGVIRPLIGAKRCDIEKYLKDINQTYVTDETNFSNLYKRNSLRNNLIPYIEEHYNPNYIETAACMVEELARDYSFIEKNVNDAIKNIKFPVDLKEISCYDDVVLIRIFCALCGVSFSKNAKNNLIKYLRRGKTGTSFPVNKTRYLYIEYGKIYFKEYVGEYEYSYKLKLGENYISELDAVFIVSEGKGFGKDTVNISDLSDIVLRNRRYGDRIYIKNINGSKKLKDIFIDRKIPIDHRKIWPVVTENGEIVWLTGIYKNEKENIKYNIKVKWRQNNV